MNLTRKSVYLQLLLSSFQSMHELFEHLLGERNSELRNLLRQLLQHEIDSLRRYGEVLKQEGLSELEDLTLRIVLSTTVAVAASKELEHEEEFQFFIRQTP